MIAEAGTIIAADQPAPPAELLEVVASSGLTGDSVLVIQTAFCPFFLQAAEWQAKIATVTDPKVARESRLMLKKIRVEAEHKKDDLKADALRYSRAVDGAFKKIESAIKPMEAALDEIERKAEREAQAKRAALVTDRTAKLAAYGVDPTFFALGDMPEDHFAKLLDQSRLAHEAKIAAEARAKEEARIAAEKAEAERIAREKAAAEERERVRLENERLKREAAEREEAARKERERAEKLDNERVEILRPYCLTGDAIGGTYYGNMSDEQFAAILADAKRRKEERERIEQERARIEAERRAEKERAAAVLKLRTDCHYARMKVIAPYMTATECMSVPPHAYADASDEQFAAVVNERKAQHEERARLAKEAAEREAAAKAERERLEREKREAEERAAAERARIEADNAAKLAEMRRVAEEQARIQREATEALRAKVEAAKRAQEAKEKAEREAAERAAAAPDREKLLAFAATIRAIQLPEMATPKGKALMKSHAAMLESMANTITREAGEL